MFHDRTFKSGSYSAKHAYQGIKCTLDGNILTVKNLYDFTNLNEYNFKYSVELDGRTVSENTLTLDVAPKNISTLTLDLPDSCMLGTFVTCRLLDKNGYEVAFDQLDAKVPCQKIADGKDAVSFTENDNEIIASGDGFSYSISKHQKTRRGASSR